MTCFSTFVFGVLLLVCITQVSADGMGLGYGSLFMQHDVKEETKPQVPERLQLNSVAKEVFNEVIEGGREILKGLGRIVLDYKYELNATDMDQLHDCYFFKHFRNGMMSNASELTEQEQFCKRLIDFKPTYTEATAYGVAHRFEAMSKAFNNFSSTNPFYPTKDEMLEIEECFFSRPQEQMNTNQLSPSETFCQRLQSDILNGTEILDGSYPFGPYHNFWHDLTFVARKDYAQILQCHSKMFNQRFSGPCKGYFKLIHNSTTVRDFRRKHVDACMRMKLRSPTVWTENKDKCLKIISQYKRIFCGFTE